MNEFLDAAKFMHGVLGPWSVLAVTSSRPLRSVGKLLTDLPFSSPELSFDLVPSTMPRAYTASGPCYALATSLHYDDNFMTSGALERVIQQTFSPSFPQRQEISCPHGGGYVRRILPLDPEGVPLPRRDKRENHEAIDGIKGREDHRKATSARLFQRQA